MTITFRCFTRWIAAAIILSLGLAGSAHALFPPPFFNPTGVGGVTTDPPPDPFVPPPPPCTCPPPGGHVAGTPEPATLISGVFGLSILAGYGIRRRIKK
jgi:hypothetical protein